MELGEQLDVTLDLKQKYSSVHAGARAYGVRAPHFLLKEVTGRFR
jgi:hypothetical protein